jgi:hypothetical protein
LSIGLGEQGQVTRLGDEEVAQQEKDSEGERKDKQTRINEYNKGDCILVCVNGQSLNK